MTSARGPRVAALVGLLSVIVPELGLAQRHVPLPAVNLGGSSFLDGAGGAAWPSPPPP
jgi:hypothetical protein